MKKGVLENVAKFTGKPFGSQTFKNIFFTEHHWTTASGVLPAMFGKTQMNIHYLETLILEVSFRYIISFSAT